MGFSIEFDVPANGRLRQAKAAAIDDDGKVITTDKLDLESMKDRNRYARGMARKLKLQPKDVLDKIEAGYATLATSLRRAQREEKEDDGPKENDKASHATVLVALATRAGAVLFHDHERQGYATIPIGDRKENWPLRSTNFRRWLSERFYQLYGKSPGGQAVADAILTLEGKADFGAPEHAVHVRLAEHEGKIYLDLADKDWQVVEVDAVGWRIVRESPVKFRRPRGVQSLPLPQRGGTVAELRRFVNAEATDSDYCLLVGWVLQALRPRGPYPVLCLHGEQGCAKSTLARVVRCLIDPNISPLRSAPRNPHDLMIAATNAWVVAFDNLSHLQDWLSDALCRLATGGGFSTRELYTNDEEKIFDAMRPCVLTSIEDLASRGDLLERSIILRFPEIKATNRRTEKQFWVEFEEARPRILGALLSALSEALARVDTVQLDSLPRMADFAVWATAAEPGLGWPRGSFLQAYQLNQREANQLALEGSLVYEPLRKLLEQENEWKGSATDLLERLAQLAGEQATKSSNWPKKPNALSGHLRRLAPNLRRVGVGVEFDRKPGGGRGRSILLTRQENGCETSSPSSPSSHESVSQDEQKKSDTQSRDDPGTVRGTIVPEKTAAGDDRDDRDDRLHRFSGDGVLHREASAKPGPRRSGKL
jgi:hypothetical protein